jgi:hypothetical protein
MKTLIVILAVVSFNYALNTDFKSLASPLSQTKTRFTSFYTKNLKNCGSGMTKKEEKEADERGQDTPTVCQGPKGYKLYIGYSCCSSIFGVTDKNNENISLAQQAVNWKQETVEWRLANGEPFAVIMRYYTYAGEGDIQLSGKITGEFLQVTGLKGYEQITGEVDVKKTKNPNAEARKIADKGYAKKD